MAIVARWPVPRVRRAHGYRSKPPAVREEDRVNSYVVTGSPAVRECVIETRGNTILSCARVGDLARSFFGQQVQR